MNLNVAGYSLLPALPEIVLAIGAGALAVSGAIFMILELQNAHAGILRISDAPLRFALQQLENEAR